MAWLMRSALRQVVCGRVVPVSLITRRSPPWRGLSKAGRPPAPAAPITVTRASVRGSGVAAPQGAPAAAAGEDVAFDEKLELEDWTGAPDERLEDIHVPISAYYIGRNIDVVKLAHHVPEALNGAVFRCQASHLLLGLSNSMIERLDGASGVVADQQTAGKEEAGYVAVFRFGSVCFLGIDDKKAQRAVVKYVREFVTLPLLQPPPPIEEHAMWLRGKGGKITDFPNETPAERLDRKAVVVICTVLGQSVALDAHSANADRLLELFRGFNELVLKSGRIPHRIERQRLFTMIAENNSIHADVISGSRLHLFDKTEEGWQDAQTWQLSNDLREEFEMEQRYTALQAKMELIHENSKFFLEVLHNSHSNRIETAILALIALEVVLAILHKV